jgi:hypothetical protein
MRVLKLALHFFCNFSFSFYFQCGAFGRLLLASGRMWLRRPDSKITRPDACGLSHAYVATRVRTGIPLVINRVLTLAAAQALDLTRFFRTFWLLVLFSWFSQNLASFCPLVLTFLLSRYILFALSIPFTSFFIYFFIFFYLLEYFIFWECF